MSEKLKIMVVDDEPIILESFRDYFDEYPIETFNDPRMALDTLSRTFYDIVISDYRMPGLSGLDLFLESKRKASYDTGILLTAYADKQLLLDFINKDLVKKIVEKPLDLPGFKGVLDESITECLRRREREEKLDLMRYWYDDPYLSGPETERRIIGFNGSLKNVFRDVINIAETNENILITGETGTGKELIARMIHRRSPNRFGAFVSINCGALPETLVESELFGYVKGAFTGAAGDKRGKIELAHNGTLFLDEIGELKPDLQVKLLHVVQGKEVERLGANRSRKVDFRLITATNRDLKAAIIDGSFREDLYYRIGTIPIHLPPLREREEDLEELITYLLDKYARELGRKPVRIHPDALEKMKVYPWPGNIRELENVLKRAVILLNRETAELEAETFSYLFTGAPDTAVTPQNAIDVLSGEVIGRRLGFREIERGIISGILDRYDGNIKTAVRETGISKDKFYRSRK